MTFDRAETQLLLEQELGDFILAGLCEHRCLQLLADYLAEEVHQQGGKGKGSRETGNKAQTPRTWTPAPPSLQHGRAENPMSS